MKISSYNIGNLGYLYPYGLRTRPSYSSALLLLLAACGGGGGGGGGVTASDNQPNPLPVPVPVPVPVIEPGPDLIPIIAPVSKPIPNKSLGSPLSGENISLPPELIFSDSDNYGDGEDGAFKLPDRNNDEPVYETKVGSYYGNEFDDNELLATSSGGDNSYGQRLFDELIQDKIDFPEGAIKPFDLLPVISGSNTVTPPKITFHNLINLDKARAKFPGINGEGYSIVIIDSGIDFNHSVFGDRIIFGYDLSKSDENETFQDGWEHGHGTVVSSIAAGQQIGNFKGGIAPKVNIIALQILNNENITDNKEIEAAFQWVIQNAEAFNIVAVNFSISNPNGSKLNKDTPTVYSDEFRILARLGVSIVVAAGNNFKLDKLKDGTANDNKGVLGTSNFASDPFTIAVGALTKENTLTDFTERAEHVIFAPGQDIYAANRHGGFNTNLNGSSYSAPIITGAVVLAQQLAESKIGRRLTFSEINKLLFESSETIGDSNYKRFLLDKFLDAVDEFTENIKNPDDHPDKIGDVISVESFDVSKSQLFWDGIISPPQDKDNKASSSDHDWFKVNLPAGMYQLIMLAKDIVGNILDSFLTVYLPIYDITFKNDDHHLTISPVKISYLDAGLTFILNEKQDIYIGASATPYAVKDQKKKEGDYQLFLTQIESETSSKNTLLPLEVDVFTFEVVKDQYYALSYKFTLDPSVIPANPASIGNLPVNQHLKGHYNNLTARIYYEDGGKTKMQKLPIHTFPTPSLPKEQNRPDEQNPQIQFNPQLEKPTILQAKITGEYRLILSDPHGRKWDYEIEFKTTTSPKPPEPPSLPPVTIEPGKPDNTEIASIDNAEIAKPPPTLAEKLPIPNPLTDDEKPDSAVTGGKGADIIDGGDGVDTVSYIGSDQGVTVDLSDLTVETDDHPTLTNAQTGGHAEGDTLKNIENLVGSKHNDILTGDDGRNILRGDAGDDILDGGAGNDILDGGAGNDRLTGGSGGDKYILKQTNEGTDTVIDFKISDGDKIQIDTVDSADSDLAGIGVYIQDGNNDGHAEIVNASDASQIYMILENIDFEEITDTNFSTYFEVI